MKNRGFILSLFWFFNQQAQKIYLMSGKAGQSYVEAMRKMNGSGNPYAIESVVRELGIEQFGSKMSVWAEQLGSKQKWNPLEMMENFNLHYSELSRTRKEAEEKAANERQQEVMQIQENIIKKRKLG